ncbi:MAG: hypothetical protein ACQEP1_06825 [Nanobdellota archaeon]
MMKKYLRSLKEIDKRVFYVAGFAVSFYIIVALIGSLMSALMRTIDFSPLKKMGEELQGVSGGALQQGVAGSLESVSALKEAMPVLSKLTAIALTFIILTCAVWAFTRYLMYKQIYKKKFSWKGLGRYVLISLLFIFIFSVLTVGSSKIVIKEYLGFFSLGLLMIFAYFYTFFNIYYFKKEEFVKSVNKALRIVGKTLVGLGALAILITLLAVIGIIFGGGFLGFGIALVLFIAGCIYFGKNHKKHWKKVMKHSDHYIRDFLNVMLAFFTVSIAGGILTLVLRLLNFTNNPVTGMIISILIFLFYLVGFSWLRFFMVKVAKA